MLFPKRKDEAFCFTGYADRCWPSAGHLNALGSLTSDEVDVSAVTSCVCSLYGYNTLDINEARYKLFMRVSGGRGKNPLSNLKNINSASLSPYAKSLGNHIKRAQFVAMLWKKADGNNPTGGLNPKDYGWQIVDDMLEPDWYAGNSIPDSLSNDDDETDETPMNIMNQVTNLNGVRVMIVTTTDKR